MMNLATHTDSAGETSNLVAMVPRIHIHAFCDSQQTAEAMQAASADRRMSKSHVTVQMGGIMAAVQVYQSAATPNALLVESHGSREQILSELGQLAQVCQPNTKVIVIGHLNDVILYRELMRQGVSEYLVAPLHQLQIIETIATLYQDPNATPVGRVIAFVGAKGGVGSSTLAHNFAWQMSNRYSVDTVITDLDLAFGTAGLNFNQDSSSGILDALGQPDRIDSTLLDRMLTKLGDKLSLLSGPGGVDREVTIEAHAVETIMGALRQSVPCVVVDVPNLWAPWIKYTLVHADEVVITATPDLASLRNTKNLVDMLKQARPNDKPPKVVLNQVGVPKRPEIPPAEFGKAIGIDVCCIIPYDPQTFGTAQSNGQMVFAVAPKSKAAEAVAAMSKIFAPADKPVTVLKPSSSSLLSKLTMLRKK